VTAACEYEDDPGPVPDWWPYQDEFPRWHVWRGVAGILYARKPKSSPPQVVRGDTVDKLASEIRRSEDAAL
jgi:hypothetical protein